MTDQTHHVSPNLGLVHAARSLEPKRSHARNADHADHAFNHIYRMEKVDVENSATEHISIHKTRANGLSIAWRLKIRRAGETDSGDLPRVGLLQYTMIRRYTHTKRPTEGGASSVYDDTTVCSHPKNHHRDAN